MKLVKGRWSGKYWVENEKGRRVSDKIRSFSGHSDYGPISDVYGRTDSTLRYIPCSHFIVTPDRFFEISDNVPMQIYDVKNIQNKYYSILVEENENPKVCITYDRDGKLISDEMFIESYDEKMGLMTVWYKGKIGYMDENLKWVISPKFLSQKTKFINGRAVVEIKKDTCVIIDTKGNYIGKPFNATCARVILDDTPLFAFTYGAYVGIVDFDGNIVIPAEYDEIDKSGDYFKLKLNGKYGLADSNGDIIWDCIYPEIIDLKNKFVVQELSVKEMPRKQITK